MEMTMSWDDCDKAAESPFLSWDEGPFELRFPTQPKLELQHFPKGGGSPEVCTLDECKICDDIDRGESTYKPMDRSFVFDVVRYPDGDPKVLRLSVKAYNRLKQVRDAQGDKFSTAKIKCSKSGSGKKTDYSFILVDFVDDAMPF